MCVGGGVSVVYVCSEGVDVCVCVCVCVCDVCTLCTTPHPPFVPQPGSLYPPQEVWCWAWLQSV